MSYWHPLLEENQTYRSILLKVRDSLKTRLVSGPFDDFLSRDIIFISQYFDDHGYILDLHNLLEKNQVSFNNLKLLARNANQSLIRLNELKLLTRYFGLVEPLPTYNDSELNCFNQSVNLLYIIQNKNWQSLSEHIVKDGLDFHGSMCYHKKSSTVYTKEDIQNLSNDKTQDRLLVNIPSKRVIKFSPWQRVYEYVDPGTNLIFSEAITTDSKPRGYSKDCPGELYPKELGFIHIEIYSEPERLWNSRVWQTVRFVYKIENEDYKLKALMFNYIGV